ncbi:hypothetical protein B0T10DRAFT_493094 [Thelonectria olida]|uniref:Uncharacterized protein n=1 Tax=Thelonectria olida TaxID=1576542 RepID=A0A9P8VYX7_9HYPO|nr:hypothetical protein B0T10DRAFT_493094 [Thelonectria olida]
MTHRSVYLAKYGGSKNQRAHFAIFVPNAQHDRKTVSQDFESRPTSGTVIHVVGEPVMAGYVLEIKRNYECSTSRDLKKLVLLGHVDASNVHNPSSADYRKENTAKGPLEQYAARVAPPPRGQNVRAPIDGVRTKRCQEWTMEFLGVLVNEGLLGPEALQIAQEERDPPTRGIFGYRQA